MRILLKLAVGLTLMVLSAFLGFGSGVMLAHGNVLAFIIMLILALATMKLGAYVAVT